MLKKEEKKEKSEVTTQKTLNVGWQPFLNI